MIKGSQPEAAPSVPDRESRQIRIALLITDLDVGGAERALVELATRLDRSRFQPRVYSLLAPAADPSRSLMPRLVEAGVPVEPLDARGIRDFFRVKRRLSDAWRAWQPHIVQTFLYHANLIGRMAARRAAVPYVVCGIRVAEQRRGVRLWVDRRGDRLVDRYVCVSQAVADFSRARGLPAEKLVVIPNGIEVAKYDNIEPVAPADLGLPPGRRLVAYIGRLDRQKGLDWMLANARLWLDRLPRHDLVLVGDGPQRAELERSVRRLGIDKRVHFTGWRSDVPGILAGSELLVLPSRWEGMPNVVLEAMASRQPVLCTDVEGVRELLGEDAHPQVVSFGDSADWSDKLVTLATDRQLAESLGKRNRRRVQARFTRAAMVQAYESLYLSLAARQRGGPQAGGE
ncbi:MAG: glycosyltransferase [Planctomycetia bacterium]|nr:glycosyltransferase [Planctomycetia bacterium]